MGKGNKNKSAQKSASKEGNTVSSTPTLGHTEGNLLSPTPDTNIKSTEPISAPADNSNGTVSHVALQLENEELKRTIVLLTSEKDRLSAELLEKDDLLLKKTTDLTLILTFVDEIDVQVELAKKEMIRSETETTVQETKVEDGDLAAIHAKRMVDLISILTNMKVQLSSQSAELTTALSVVRELTSRLADEQERCVQLSKEINEMNENVERVEDEKMSLYSKYKHVLERSLEDLEIFRAELRDTINELDASYSQLAAMEAEHQKELENLKTDTEEARVEWSHKEEVYQVELAQLREAIRLLEEDKREALERLQSELETSREELLEAVNELNQSMNDSIVEMASATEVVDDIEASREHQRRGLHHRNQELDAELTQLRELLTEETLQWQQKEQQYLDEIAALRAAIAEAEEQWKLRAELYEDELQKLRDEKVTLEKEKSIALEKFESELEASKEELLETMNELNNSTVSFNQSITEFIGDEAQYLNELEQLKEQLNEAEERNQQQRDQRRTIEEELKEVQRELDEMKEHKKQALIGVDESDEIVALKAHNQQLTQWLSEASDTHNKALQELQAQLAEMQLQLAENANQSKHIVVNLTTSEEALKNDVTRLTTELAAVEEAWRANVQEFQAEIEQRDAEIEELKLDMAKVEDELISVKEELLQTVDNLNTSITSRTDAETEWREDEAHWLRKETNYQNEIAKLKLQWEESSMEWRDRELAMQEELQNSQTEWQLKESELLSELEQLKQTQLDDRQIREGLQKELGEVQAKLAHVQALYQQALNELKICWEHSENEKQRSTESLTTSERTCDELRTRCEQLEQDLAAVRQSQTTKADSVSGLQVKLTEMMQQLEMCEAVQSQKIDDLKSQLKLAVEQKLSAEAELRSVVADLQTVEDGHQSQVKQLQDEIDRLHLQMEEVLKEKFENEQRLTQELDDAKEELLNAVTELNESKDTFNQSFEEFNQDTEELNAEITGLKDEKTVTEKKLIQLQSLYQKALSDLKQSRDTNDENRLRYQSESSQWHDEKEKLHAQLATLTESVDSLTAGKADVESKNFSLLLKVEDLQQELKQSKIELSRVNEESSVVQQRMVETEKALSDSQQKLVDLQNEFMPLRTKSEETETKFSKLQSLYESALNDLSQFKENAMDATIRHQEMKSAVEFSEVEMERLTAVLTELNESVSTLTAGKAEAEAKNFSLLMKVTDLKQELSDARNQHDADVSRVETELSSAKTEALTLQQQLHVFESALIESNTKLAELTSELTSVQTKLNDKSEEAETSLGDRAAAEAKNFTLLLEVEDLRDQIKKERAEHKADIDRLEARLEFTQKFEEREVATLLQAQSDLQAELTQMQLNLQDKAEDLNCVLSEKEAVDSRNLYLVVQLETLQNQAKTEREALMNEIRSLESQLPSVDKLEVTQKELAALQKQVEDLQAELSSVQAMLQSRSDELARAVNEKAAAESKNFSLLLQVDDCQTKLKSEREDHCKDISSLESQLNASVDQLERLKREAAEAEKMNDELTTQLSAARKTVNELTTAVERLSVDLQTSRNDQQTVDSKLVSLVLELEEARYKQLSASDELEQVKTDKATAEKKVSHLQGLYQQALNNLKIANEATTSSKQSELQALAEAERRLAEVQSKCSDLEANNQELSTSLMEATKHHNLQVSDLTSQVHALQRQSKEAATTVKDLTQKLTAATSSADSLKTQYNDSKAQWFKDKNALESSHKSVVDKWEAQCESLKLQVSQLENEKQSLMSDLNVANESLAELASKVSRAQQSSRSESDQVQSLTASLNELKELHAAIVTELKEKLAQSEATLNAKTKGLNAALSAATEQLKAHTAVISSSESTINGLKKNLIDVEDMYSASLCNEKRLKDELADTERQRQELLRELTDVNDSLEELSNEVEALRNSSSVNELHLSSENERLDEALTQCQRNLETSLDQNRAQAEQLETTMDLLNQVTGKLEVERKDHRELQTLLKELVSRYDKNYTETGVSAMKRLEYLLENQRQGKDELHSLKEECHETSEALNEANEKAEELQAEVRTLRNKLFVGDKELASEVRRLMNENKELTGTLQTRSDELSAAQKALLLLKQRWEDLQQQHEQLVREHGDLWRDRASASQQIESLKVEWSGVQELHDTEKRQLTDELHRVNELVQSVRTELDQLQRERQNLVYEKTAAVELTTDELEFVKKELVVYQSKYAHVDSENQALQKQMEDAKNKHTKRTSELFDVINHLRDECEQLKQGHNGDLNSYEHELSSVMADLREANDQLNDMSRQLAESEQHRDALQSDVHALENELDHLRELYQHAIGDRNHIAESDQNLMEATRQELHEVQGKFAELMVEVGRTQDKLHMAKQENVDLWNSLNAANATIKEQQNDIHRLHEAPQQELMDTQHRVAELEMELRAAQRSFQELQEFHTHRTTELQELLANADAVYTKEIADLSAAVNAASTAKAAELAAMQQVVDDLKAKLREVKAKHTLEVSHLVTTMKNVGVEVDKQSSALTKSQDRLKAVRAENKLAHAELTSAHETIESLRNELMQSADVQLRKSTRSELHSLRMENQDLWNRLNGANETIGELERELNQLQTKMWKMTTWA